MDQASAPASVIRGVETTDASWRIYIGLFLITLATLMFEILLTRIFSVTMYYHYAFMAISMALFGMTAGAVIVYLLPARFAREKTAHQLTLSALGFAVTIVASFLVHLTFPVVAPRLPFTATLVETYVVISVPFVFSGVCVALTLTRFPRQVSTLYAADLVGAACGCVLLIVALNLMDGPTAVVVTGAVAGVGAVFFAAETGAVTLARAAVVTSTILGLFALTNAVLAHHQSPLLRLTWVKGAPEARPLYEKWNSFSRITVRGNPGKPRAPYGWGISARSPHDLRIRQLGLTIDAAAYTVITAFDGDVRKLQYLKYDVSNLAYYIRRDAKVLVVGPGGGRDILAALTFKQRSVLAVEINRDILGAVNGRFGDFSGHLDRDPRVRFINDEARSYIAKTSDRFDIIQLSLVDTAAATAAGAYVLTENSLYTTEAWTLFLERLTPTGMLSVSRWSIGDRPSEIYRVTALASAALKRLGVGNPRSHILIVWRSHGIHPVYGRAGLATILVSRAPFSAEDLATIEDVSRRLEFDVVLSPRTALDATFVALASGENLERVAAAFPVNIAPATDDSPFFFNMVRLRDAFHRNPWAQGTEIFNAQPVYILAVLLVVVVLLTLACIIAPLILTSRKQSLDGATPFFVYFAAIGIGFMMVEISQMQRLIIFLGHPTYGLSVVLFALLVSSGLGSAFTQTLRPAQSRSSAMKPLGLLLCALLVFGVATPHAIEAFRGATTTLRILVAVAVLFPLGVFMGMAFPLGMALASSSIGAVTPWLWGINGATSVCASVLAVAVAMSTGISTSFWVGAGCYAVAVAAFAWVCQSHPRRASAIDSDPLSAPPIALSAPGE